MCDSAALNPETTRKGSHAAIGYDETDGLGMIHWQIRAGEMENMFRRNIIAGGGLKEASQEHSARCGPSYYG